MINSATNCHSGGLMGGGILAYTPPSAIMIDKVDGGWIVTRDGRNKAIASTYEELVTLLKDYFDPKGTP